MQALRRAENGSDADAKPHSPPTALGRHGWILDHSLVDPDLHSAIVQVLCLRESLLMGSWVQREDLILGLILAGLYLLWILW